MTEEQKRSMRYIIYKLAFYIYISSGAREYIDHSVCR